MYCTVLATVVYRFMPYAGLEVIDRQAPAHELY